MHRPKSYWKVAVLLVCLALGIWLTWDGFHGRLRYPTLWTLGYLVLLIVLVRTNVIERASSEGAAIGVWGRLSDLVKGAVLMIVGIGWAILSAGRVSDTSTGVVIVLAPFGGLLLIGAFFLLRGFIKNLQ
jgi:hypothetical protein